MSDLFYTPLRYEASVISAMEILSYRDIPCDIAVHTMLFVIDHVEF